MDTFQNVVCVAVGCVDDACTLVYWAVAKVVQPTDDLYIIHVDMKARQWQSTSIITCKSRASCCYGRCGATQVSFLVSSHAFCSGHTQRIIASLLLRPFVLSAAFCGNTEQSRQAQ